MSIKENNFILKSQILQYSNISIENMILFQIFQLKNLIHSVMFCCENCHFQDNSAFHGKCICNSDISDNGKVKRIQRTNLM